MLLRWLATDEIAHALVGAKQPENAFTGFDWENRFQEDHGVHQSVRGERETLD